MTKTPYVDAISPTDVSNALKAVSDQFATCSFDVNGVEAKADKAGAHD